MSGVFISYRRDDCPGWAQAINGLLEDRLGADSVFMDVADIRPGSDFPLALDEVLSKCSVMLVLIGKKWSSAHDQSGARRLDEPTDWVRHEIVSALERRIYIVPVLLDDARMPSADELPDPMKPLARRNAVPLRHARLRDDLSFLLESVPDFAQLAVRRKRGGLSGIWYALTAPPATWLQKSAVLRWATAVFSVFLLALGLAAFVLRNVEGLLWLRGADIIVLVFAGYLLAVWQKSRATVGGESAGLWRRITATTTMFLAKFRLLRWLVATLATCLLLVGMAACLLWNVSILAWLHGNQVAILCLAAGAYLLAVLHRTRAISIQRGDGEEEKL